MGKVDVLKINEFEQSQEQADFYCNDFRTHLQTHHKAITVPHKHNFFLTVLFTQGTGIHEIDFEKYQVKAGSVFMLNPGQAHYWELSADVEGIIFFHSQAFFDLSFVNQSIYDFPFFYSVHNPSALFLNLAEAKAFLNSFQLVLAEYRGNEVMKKHKIASLIHCIYIDLSRVYLNNAPKNILKSGTYSEYLRSLEALIDQNFKEDKSPSSYADKLNITIRHLNRLTQESLGKSPTQLIAERVILEAKRMIVHDASSLTKIAYDLGYEDYAYFSRLFKKWSGITPSAFSKSYK